MSFTVEDAPWWTRAVVYQIYPRSFADSDGDGIGDLRGILEHLDHLSALGVDVVWLSPIYRSPQDDNGYDISDYQDVDPMFGTLADLDELIAALHERGMRLVMDLVVNHTSDEHPWFVESRSSAHSPKRDWYWWRPPREGHALGEPGAEPTNWHSFFSGSTWQADPATDEYYLHLFSPKQPDLNWENPEVRQAVYAMMRWWLDRGVDGFRMDVINLISKDTDLPDGPALTVGETTGVTLEHAQLFTDPARAELDMVFQFDHVFLDHGPGGKFDPRPMQLTDLKAVLGRWQDGLAEVGWNSLYWNNHDQPRVVSRFGDDGRYRRESAKALATLLHLHRGTPYIYQGEELGMTNAHFTRFDQYQDIESLNHVAQARELGTATDEQLLTALAYISRDNARTPVQWTSGEQAGFTTGTPWLEVNANYRQVNAVAERADQDSVFHHYRRLIALRHEDPVVALGDFRMLLPQDEQVYAYTRTLDGESLVVVVNVSGEEREVDLGGDWPLDEDDGWGELVLGTHPRWGQRATVLRPWEARVHRSPRSGRAG